LSRRRGHVKVFTFLAEALTPGSKHLAGRRVEGELVDVVGGGPPRHTHDVVVLQRNLLPLDLVLEDPVDAAVRHLGLVRVEQVHRPNKPLVHYLDPLREPHE